MSLAANPMQLLGRESGSSWREDVTPIVFVVDDEKIIALTLELILIQKGFDARSFVDPLDALYAARIVAPDLLITDVVMPQMNGIELAIHFKVDCPNCRILLFSGQGATNDLIQNALAQGHAFELLAKPVHPDELMETIEQILHSSGSRA